MNVNRLLANGAEPLYKACTVAAAKCEFEPLVAKISSLSRRACQLTPVKSCGAHAAEQLTVRLDHNANTFISGGQRDLVWSLRSAIVPRTVLATGPAGQRLRWSLAW